MSNVLNQETSDNTTSSHGEVFVYIVECSSGDHDDYSKWFGGVFEKKEDAEKHAQSLNDKMEELKHSDCPVDTPIEDMTDQEEEAYTAWHQNKIDAE